MSNHTTYVALLRGINVGGKSIVKMAELKACIEELGYENVATYINSGNVLFTAVKSARQLETEIEPALDSHFGLPIRVMVRSLADMERVNKLIPDDWLHDTVRKHDIIFLSHTIDDPNIIDDLHPKPDIEELTYHPGVLMWSVDVKAFSHSNVAKIAGTKLRQEMTVRGPGTVRKVYELMQKAEKA
jgi:uncharacterized protein (DUF1697 family)